MHCGVPIAADGRSRAPEKRSIAKSPRVGTISSSCPNFSPVPDVRHTRRMSVSCHDDSFTGELQASTCVATSIMLKPKHLSHDS